MWTQAGEADKGLQNTSVHTVQHALHGHGGLTVWMRLSHRVHRRSIHSSSSSLLVSAGSPSTSEFISSSPRASFSYVGSCLGAGLSSSSRCMLCCSCKKLTSTWSPACLEMANKEPKSQLFASMNKVARMLPLTLSHTDGSDLQHGRVI